jgi:hypothetical protein
MGVVDNGGNGVLVELRNVVELKRTLKLLFESSPQLKAGDINEFLANNF